VRNICNYRIGDVVEKNNKRKVFQPEEKDDNIL
jgi:hypothetical protein